MRSCAPWPASLVGSIFGSVGSLFQLQYHRCGLESQLRLNESSSLAASHTTSQLVCFFVGLAFLLAFYAWGLLYLRSLTVSAAGKIKQSLWGLVSASSTALLAGQIVVQAIYKAGDAGWATDEHTKRVLQLFGLNRADSALHLVLVSTSSPP